MNCDKYSVLISAYIDNELDMSVAKKFEEHINKCTRCRQDYEFTLNMVNACAAIDELDLPVGFEKSFHDKLIVAHNDMFKGNTISKNSFLKSFNLKALSTIAAGVVLVIAVGTIFPMLYNNMSLTKSHITEDAASMSQYASNRAMINETLAQKAADEKLEPEKNNSANENSDTTMHQSAADVKLEEAPALKAAVDPVITTITPANSENKIIAFGKSSDCIDAEFSERQDTTPSRGDATKYQLSYGLADGSEAIYVSRAAIIKINNIDAKAVKATIIETAESLFGGVVSSDNSDNEVESSEESISIDIPSDNYEPFINNLRTRYPSAVITKTENVNLTAEYQELLKQKQSLEQVINSTKNEIRNSLDQKDNVNIQASLDEQNLRLIELQANIDNILYKSNCSNMIVNINVR